MSLYVRIETQISEEVEICPNTVQMLPPVFITATIPVSLLSAFRLAYFINKVVLYIKETDLLYQYNVVLIVLDYKVIDKSMAVLFRFEIKVLFPFLR